MSAMPETQRNIFALHARLSTHHRKIELARARVKEWLTKCSKPYTAFSAGKDSTCILALVREQMPECPAVYFNADCAFPEVEILLAATPDLIDFPADEPFLDTLKRCGLGGEAVERETMKTTVYGPIKRLVAQYDFDGICYGLRAEESPKTRGLHARLRGAVFQYKRDGLWGCQPIWDWRYMDVWAFIVGQGLPYCGTYDKLWDAPVEDQRISYWAGETKRRWGRYAWLKRNYPELFNRLAAEIPEARSYV